MTNERDTFRTDAGEESSGGAGDFALALPKAKKRQLSQQSLVTLMVVVVGAGGLFAMRKMGLGPQATQAGTKVDFDVQDGASADSLKQYQRMIDRLRLSARPVQVPQDRVVGNPFAMQDVATDLEASEPTRTGPTSDELARQAREKRLQEVTNELGTLKLQSVMGGRVPLARINDKILKIGDKVGKNFELVSIEGRTAVLSAEGLEFELTLGQSVDERNAEETGG
ncbi:MAG: hypothetical protein RBS39_06655 [Phycisphaerales bacterium]|jgi:hypothetical protein|nr:hypothetical protein [Phycisphaerales bacterium]